MSGPARSSLPPFPPSVGSHPGASLRQQCAAPDGYVLSETDSEYAPALRDPPDAPAGQLLYCTSISAESRRGAGGRRGRRSGVRTLQLRAGLIRLRKLI